jgi:tetratricopeptide (TPR) repeat protein
VKRAALLVAFAFALPAEAGERDKWSWDRTAGPASADGAYRQALRRADQKALRAAEQVNLGETMNGRTNKLAIEAADAYEKAAKLRPSAAEPHYRAAAVLYEHFVDDTDHPSSQPAARVIRHWREFERLAPRDPRAFNMLFRRSLTYTKLGGPDNFARAAADYESMLRLVDSASSSPEDMSLYLSNAAEIHMALGNIDRSIELYVESLEFYPNELYAYGLIVALDRDGQATKALEMMRGYKYNHEVLFPKPPRPAPFFVPDGDVHWYQSIGYESLGQYQSALNHMNQFLAFQPRSPYAARAKERIKSLAVKARRFKEKKITPEPTSGIRMRTFDFIEGDAVPDEKAKKKKPRKKSK